MVVDRPGVAIRALRQRRASVLYVAWAQLSCHAGCPGAHGQPRSNHVASLNLSLFNTVPAPKRFPRDEARAPGDVANVPIVDEGDRYGAHLQPRMSLVARARSEPREHA